MGKYLKSLSICKSSSSLYSVLLLILKQDNNIVTSMFNMRPSWSLFFQRNKWFGTQIPKKETTGFFMGETLICSIASYVANVEDLAIIHNYHLQFQWHNIGTEAVWRLSIFLAHHNVVPNVDKVKYMGIALHHITLPKP